ncbi:unnamed protein product [Orchesella dallaii]|uniref:Cyclic nucleotide-binding domain-containing protein n=1 Tax=Orchesella dallaii TaxID=48710 RepID=A0ABP1RGC5_9HEXA
MAFRPSQWWSFIIADVVGRAKALLPALKQWIFYGFRRVLLFYAVKHSIDTFWLIFKTRKLGVTYARELSLMSWVPSNCNYEWNPGMRVFIRKCGYHCSPAGMVMGRHVEPWFYSEVKDDTKTILEQMEAKALRFEHHDKVSQAEEMKAVARVLRNFKDFNMDEIMVFFKVSELLTMEKDQVIFGANDVEQYFYGVVDGEINLYCEGVGNREKDLLKVAGSDECIVSISAFLYYFAKYIKSDKKKMSEIFSTILIRQQKFMNGLNDLTGIIPRLHKQSYLDSHYTPIDTDPGVIQLDSEVRWNRLSKTSKKFLD